MHALHSESRIIVPHAWNSIIMPEEKAAYRKQCVAIAFLEAPGPVYTTSKTMSCCMVS